MKLYYALAAIVFGVAIFAWAVADNNSAQLDGNTIYYSQTNTTWKIEIADTQEKRARGLMHVKKMDDNQGMLFIFEQPQIITMWMKNTYIPLDMIFLDEHGKIVHIEQNTKPHSLQTISSKVPAKYVLEINAGQAKKAKLKIGQSRLDGTLW